MTCAVPRIEHSRRARRDLKEIWRYTSENYGDEQADRYLAAIDEAIKRLCEDPLLGVDFGDAQIGYRRLRVARHRVFYVIRGDRIEIVRILHERMDVDRQLDEDGSD